jgi:hypothetical protein
LPWVESKMHIESELQRATSVSSEQRRRQDC